MITIFLVEHIAPSFSRGLKNVSVKEKEEAVLECVVQGTSPITVEWFKGGKKVTATKEIKIESKEDGTHRLVLISSKLEYAGHYELVATNKAGTQKTKAELKVESKQKVHFVLFTTVKVLILAHTIFASPRGGTYVCNVLLLLLLLHIGIIF